MGCLIAIVLSFLTIIGLIWIITKDYTILGAAFMIFFSVFSIYLIKRENDRIYDNKNLDYINTVVKIFIEKYKTELAVEKMKLTKVDAYKNEIYNDWLNKGILYFMKNILYKNVNIPEGYNDHIVSLINQIADNEIININNNINYQENMSGIEYEVLCSSILVKNSWKVMRTKVTGDQGVDLIAEKHHYRVAIQCKRCSSKIGNSAVQEIVAGKKYYNANYALVVSNSDFTQSAKKLALINNVYLIHHVMLNNLEGIL